MKKIIPFSQFQELDLRAALVKKVEEVEGADKLFKLSLDVGDLGERTIVAGLKPYYEKQDLEGKLLVYVANLEPREVFGIRSQGMLLAGESEDEVAIATLDREVKPGAKVH